MQPGGPHQGTGNDIDEAPAHLPPRPHVPRAPVLQQIAVEHGELIVGFGAQLTAGIDRNIRALLDATRAALDLDARIKRVERLRQLDEAVEYLSDEKYRAALERQHTQSRPPAEPAFRIVHPERD